MVRVERWWPRGALPPVALWLLGAGCEPERLALEAELSDLRTLSAAPLRDSCEKAPADRIGLDAEFLDERYPSTPRRPIPPQTLQALRLAIERLPPPVARAFERHVCRVVLVTGLRVLGSIAMLKDDAERGLIALNLDYLDQSADAWMSFKEASYFSPAPDLAIVGHLAPDEDRGALLEFVITHELGHVLDSAFNERPEVANFHAISWPRDDSLESLQLVPYAMLRDWKPVQDRWVEDLYRFVATSSFPSLTSLSNRNEDFADSLALYVHVVLAGRPFHVSVYRGDVLSAQLDSCWNEPRCEEKRAALEAILARLGS
jgi:hypothetical protein